MSIENVDKSINYIEFPLTDPGATQHFYHVLFGWEFTNWGPDYISFTGAGVEGGFNRQSGVTATKPGVLVVLYSTQLEDICERIKEIGGQILQPIYEFPGGRRFHFADPNGNELAIWSDK
ncbi:VOC family protein [Sneathiella glossodoripedis]|uniref:VOC family protein n=1 Tax=Sneathiella glossodoripedis TaxID=418853 RepID=UPI000A556FBA|nr:VOC family protein [Sneathiella glossodoripedis]